jgi:hypothetical protein
VSYVMTFPSAPCKQRVCRHVRLFHGIDPRPPQQFRVDLSFQL